MKPEIDGRQVRAARGLLDWSQLELADKADLSVLTIKRMEKNASAASVSSLSAVVAALRERGSEVSSARRRVGAATLFGVALEGTEVAAGNP